MEAHKLRFVRCPKCYQLLVEYPSIPVYKCGGCNTVLRAKNRAVPAVQDRSESHERNNFPSSLKGSLQDSRSICSDEHKIAPSVDQTCEAAAGGIMSSCIKNTNSCDDSVEERAVSVEENITPAQHQKEETCSLIDENAQNPGITVKEMHGEDTRASFGSNLIGELENIDTSENANRGKIDKVDMSAMRTPDEKTEVVQREERLHTYEGVHVESHESLIEELERSLSFSSDDDYFSDEAETSGLSDTLRHQIGSRRIMLGAQINETSRNDPHGRLIEELEMSFSDAEEPMEQRALDADRIHGNKRDNHPQNLDAERANPCGESICSLDSGHVESEQTFHQGNRLIDNGNEGKEDIDDDNNLANDVHGNDRDTHLETLGLISAHPYEFSTPSLDNGHLESEQTFLQENKVVENGNEGKGDIEGDNSTTKHIVVANEASEETFHEKRHGKDLQPASAENVYPSERIVSSIDDSNMKVEQTIQPNGIITDGTHENKEGCMDDGNMTKYINGIENMVFTDEDIADKVHGIEEVTSDRTGENEESHVEDDNTDNYVYEEENVAVADEHITEKVDKNEHGKDQQSWEAEFSNTVHVKSEVIFKQEDVIADGTKQKKEDDMGDDNTANSFKKDSAVVASFSSWSNKRTQCKLPSFNKNKEEAPYKYRARQLRQGLSLDAKDFRSIQNFIESQKDGTSSSFSSGSPSQGDLVHGRSNEVNNIVRHERLKKMDELRDQLNRLSSQKGLEEKYQKRGLEYQQQSNTYDVEQHIQNVDVDSVPNSCTIESYYGFERPPRYQPPNIFSPTHTYPHCDFGHAQARIPCNYDVWEFNSYYQSSYAESTVRDYDSMMSSYKERKRVVRKHILRPLSGASPFSICSGCFNLIQMPSDMYISKAKVGRMQCGRCSKVLVLSFPAAYHAEGNISMGVLQESNKPSGNTIANDKDATCHSAECLTGPVSTNEEYGEYLTRSFSTQAGQSLAATQSGKKVSDSALHRLMGYDTASQLLCHSRAFDDGYDSFESMVPVSSRVSRRKNMRS
ncbi:hypothetical protein PR202_gb00716 [Eleusine coracana subsp. coracana]|uniref:Zinc-ribbon domain-containing protein n=1 Tax=Eleusine coracana subsp. coracana TaxID=191504 RepID=A0AAV5DTT3_ELECO|nr:hypothetical protein QOZ80_5BG0426300 [Eleusine coracana subsp. coracana]GJN13953.1 hypothetical protein PR202_gb00716 [Eleusine coracana subsp. coracana]